MKKPNPYHRIHTRPLKLSDYAKQDIGRSLLALHNMDQVRFGNRYIAPPSPEWVVISIALEDEVRERHRMLLGFFERGELVGLS